MSDTSLARGNGPVAPSGPPRTAPPRPRSAAQRTPQRRRALIIGCGLLLVAALIIVAVITAESPIPVHALNSPQTTMAMPESDHRAATIIKDSDGKGCWRQVFDNQTGRMTRAQQPCETTTYDGNGVPIPLGTIHRLDTISKSFSGH